MKAGNSVGPSNVSKVIQDRYIVVFKDLVSNPGEEAKAMSGRLGFTVGHIYENVFKGFSASVPAQALNGLKSHPMIAYIEPDITMHASAQTIPTGIRRIEADHNLTAAINQDGGSVNVDVAIIDTGIDTEHPDLFVEGGVRFYLGFLTDSRYDDDHGHGTHVAGTIGALDNTIGVVGIAPGAHMYAVKVLNSQGSGYLSDIIKGLDWVRARADNIEVINMSLGGQGISDAYQTAIRNCVNAGIVVVVAAGNESSDIYGEDGTFGTSDDFIPAAYPEAAAISAMADADGIPGGTGPATTYGPDDSFATFSNFSNSVVAGNPVSSPGKAIDLILPGVSIYSTYKGMAYTTMSGTSMASPHAAGLVALYIAEHGRATNATGVYAIRQALINEGKAQTSTEGLSTQNDPDPNPENLGWAGTGTPPVNQPPVANLGFSANGLTVTFTDQSTDDGTIVSRSWSFGDGASSSETNPVHIYSGAGTYNVTLLVTDNGGLTASTEKPVTVSVPPPINLVLTATTSLVKNRFRVNLNWTPPATPVDIYRNGVKIATDSASPYTDNLRNKGTYVYKVCSSINECSNELTVIYN